MMFLAAGLFTASPALAAKRATLQPTAAAFNQTGVFQSLEFETNTSTGLGSWYRAISRIENERASYTACDNGSAECPAQLQEWRHKLANWKNLSPQAKLILVNRWGNTAFHYVEDRQVYHTADYWASPAQSLKGRGDCEDYVLLKYESLRALGFSESAMRIVVVNDLLRGIGHAVLSVKTSDGIFILDNQDDRVIRHDSITRYAPVYSVNTKGRWINIATNQLKKHKPNAVELVASAAELMDVLPAAAELPKPNIASTLLPAEPKVAMLDQPRIIVEHELQALPAQKKPVNMFEHWAELITPLVELLGFSKA